MLIANLAILTMLSGSQDPEEFIKKIKDVRTVTTKIFIVDPGSQEEMFVADFNLRFNEHGDLTENRVNQGGVKMGDRFEHQYDAQKRKTETTQRNLKGLLRAKSVYAYVERGAYTVDVQEYSGDEIGKEKPMDTIEKKYNAKGKIISRDHHYKTFNLNVNEEYKYDAADCLVELIESTGEEKIITALKNNEFGSPIEKARKDEVGKAIDRETFRYNEKNDYVERCVYDAKNALSVREALTYQYNERGDKIGGTFKSYASDATDPPSFWVRAEVEYEYFKK